MASCKKRAADAADAADATIAAFGDQKRPRTSARPTFLFCKPNQQVVEVLSRIGRVVTFTDFKTWPNSMPNNIKKLQAAAISASSGRSWATQQRIPDHVLPRCVRAAVVRSAKRGSAKRGAGGGVWSVARGTCG